MKESALFIFLVVVLTVEATNRFDVYSSINNVIECAVPFWTSAGYIALPEEIPILRLQPNISSVIWKPLGSRYTVPYGTPSTEVLLNFLGDDFDSDYTSINLPPPDTPEIRVSRTLSDSDVLPLDEFFTDTDNNTVQTVQEWAFNPNRNLGRCTLDSDWVKLDRSFFPRWYAGVFCNGRDCSAPRGLNCHPDISEDNPPSTVVVLNWDCCHSFIPYQNRFLFQCGWRKVKIPIISFCTCGCGPRL